MRVTQIGNLLKKIYRVYSQDLLALLQQQGFLDLRISFLEILMYLCENDAPSIKEVGAACGLKKQTMTSHLNELEKRGYIVRKVSQQDRREQKVYLTQYGEKFKLTLLEVASQLDHEYKKVLGEVELDRIIHTLQNLHTKINKDDSGQSLLI
ncbi:MAG: hypothetical protein CME62_14620 [Halobacteriovoraceae bacterium]|nr:hypothetical protein [Halobacteriovoraceae bacterium]|tara:strand:- start:6914 stop:7369 length:456 start_codon:yes stop_codon:yes gene_type:complete